MEVVRTLLDLGARIDVRNEQRETALDSPASTATLDSSGLWSKPQRATPGSLPNPSRQVILSLSSGGHSCAPRMNTQLTTR
jgi:hypothetical protein